MSPDDLIEARRDYTANTLRRNDLNTAPLAQFTRWLEDARGAKLIDATAMVVATADKSGQPHSRVVLLKQFDEAGFVWYTFQDSDKGQEIAENPQASILFYWRELERQVRIEGAVSKLDPTLADDYFYSRPEGSRFSAAASVQSQGVENRAVLEERVKKLHTEHPDGKVHKALSCSGCLLVCVVGASNHWPAGNVRKAHLHTHVFQFIKFVGVNKTHNRAMVQTRL